jgi:hypothetical protein
MARKQNDGTVYAAAQGREFLRGALEGKSNEWINEFAGLIDDPHTLDLLNYYCSLWTDHGGNFLETPIARTIITSAATHTTDRAYREGNVSQLQGMVGLTKHERDAGDAFEEICTRLADEGCIAFIVGPPGSGKTALMVDVLRGWGARTGGFIVSNLKWDGADQFVENDRQMFESMASVKGPTIAGLDELSTELTGRGKDSKKAEQFARSLTLVRKKEAKHGPYAKQGSVVGVAHTKKRLAASLRRMATLVIQKPSRKDQGKVVLYESEGGSDDLEEIGTYYGWTDTRERYGQHEASKFDVLEDDEDDDGNDLPSPKDIRRQEAIATVVRACKPWDDDEGMSYAEAASLVSYSDSWIGDRVREWLNGEHRELVSDPNEVNA